jgi:hypothetical protein
MDAKENAKDFDIDVYKNFKTFDIGGALGLGGNIFLGDKFVIDVGLRFMYGFMNVKGINGIGQTKDDLEFLESKTGEDYGSDKFKTHLFKGEASIGLKYKIFPTSK